MQDELKQGISEKGLHFSTYGKFNMNDFLSILKAQTVDRKGSFLGNCMQKDNYMTSHPIWPWDSGAMNQFNTALFSIFLKVPSGMSYMEKLAPEQASKSPKLEIRVSSSHHGKN